jgi:type I restriction enzyme S subunit
MSGWVTTKLGNVLGSGGYIRGPFGSSLLRNELLTQGIPVYEQQHAIYNHRKFRFYIGSQKHKELERFTVKENDLIISCSGTLGKVSIIKKDDPKGIISQALLILRPDINKIDIKYLYFLLVSPIGFHSIVSVSSGSVQTNIAKRSIIENTDILLPPLLEQRAIAGVLSSLDDNIDLLHRQNKTLEGMAEALWRKMFVEEADPEWKKGKLGSYLKIQGGYAFKSTDFKESGEIGIIKITNISGGLVDIVNTQFVDRKIIHTLDLKFRVATGSILIAMTGAEIGKIGIVEKTEKEIWLNQRVGMFRELKRYGKLLGYFALNSEEGQEHVLSAATGSAQPNISSTGIEDFEIPVVPDSILYIFGIAAQPFFDKICFNLSQIRTLTRLRDTLLPKLMSGVLMVKT